MAAEQPIDLNPHNSPSKPQNKTSTVVIFQLEETLLRSSPSLYPYFMLVALETGGILRALLITLLYPLIRFLLNKAAGIKVMTFLCFAGLKKDKFRLGRSVLPKHFLEDVGKEGFDRVMMMRTTSSLGMMIAVSDMPSVMVQGFAGDYLGVEAVFGRELKVVNGYYVGLMEEDRREESVLRFLDDDVLMRNGGGGICAKETSRLGSHLLHQLVGLVGCRSRDDVGDHPHLIFRHCQKVHVVTEAEKKQWSPLPRSKYPKPLIFHDGRLAFRPTFPATLAVLMWVPLGCILLTIRFIIGRFFPFRLVIPFLSLTGMQFVITGATPHHHHHHHSPRRGTVYACNHRTLIDPIVIALSLLDTAATAVTYSLSKVNAVISPIRNVPLTRDRDVDERIMKELLREGVDVVVCPEGTTCREPYLLRFSPLFAEVAAGGKIVPVAVNVGVSMFYGSTASGLKFLDPAFHLLNPCPLYSVKFLDDYKLAVPAATTTTTTTIMTATTPSGNITTRSSRIEVANDVQRMIGEELGFQCTSFTRKDKYMVLAGNTGVIS